MILAVTLSISGCLRGHPDDKSAVYNNLDKNQLRSVTVSQDRVAGVMTLKGIVSNDHEKSVADTAAQQAAPGYRIADQIEVEHSGLAQLATQAAAKSKQDATIEDQYNATIRAHGDLKDQHIESSANNGTLYLKGTVSTRSEWEEADKLARKVPDVQNVVNDLAVKPEKNPKANG